jgi:hypothetical protein
LQERPFSVVFLSAIMIITVDELLERYRAGKRFFDDADLQDADLRCIN